MSAKSKVVGVIILLATVHFAQSAEEDAMAARAMYSAWLCSTYAELSGDTDEQSRLFTLGYDKGKQFVAAVVAGTITDEEWRTIIPVTVGMLAAGPTPEFVLGRIFEDAAGQGYDHITAEDANGIPLAPENYITDEDLVASIASRKYAQGNCEVLR